MIFVKNPVAGKVKTRLALEIGIKPAAVVYRELLNHTRDVTLGLNVHKQVWYADRITEDDLWGEPDFEKKLQVEGSLGDKLAAAFEEGFQAGFDRVAAIGSDCLEIQQDHITNAFDILTKNDIVIGPAADGGYYLVGMSKPCQWLFSGMPWSSPELFTQTVERIKSRGVHYTVLPVLNDIDNFEDLKNSGLKFL